MIPIHIVPIYIWRRLYIRKKYCFRILQTPPSIRHNERSYIVNWANVKCTWNTPRFCFYPYWSNVMFINSTPLFSDKCLSGSLHFFLINIIMNRNSMCDTWLLNGLNHADVRCAQPIFVIMNDGNDKRFDIDTFPRLFLNIDSSKPNW